MHCVFVPFRHEQVKSDDSLAAKGAIWKCQPTIITEFAPVGVRIGARRTPSFGMVSIHSSCSSIPYNRSADIRRSTSQLFAKPIPREDGSSTRRSRLPAIQATSLQIGCTIAGQFVKPTNLLFAGGTVVCGPTDLISTNRFRPHK